MPGYKDIISICILSFCLQAKLQWPLIHLVCIIYAHYDIICYKFPGATIFW